MAWTAEKTSKGQDGPLVWVKVRFMNDAGQLPFELTYRTESIPTNWPDTEIKSQLARLEALDIAAVTTGPHTPPPAPTPAPPPTKEDTDRAAYFTAVNKLTELKKAQSHKAPVNPLTISDLETFIAANYKAEYY